MATISGCPSAASPAMLQRVTFLSAKTVSVPFGGNDEGGCPKGLLE